MLESVLLDLVFLAFVLVLSRVTYINLRREDSLGQTKPSEVAPLQVAAKEVA